MPKQGKLPEDPKPVAPEDPKGRLITAFIYNDRRYELWSKSWSWMEENELYQRTGLQLPKVLAEIDSGNGSPYFIGILVFFARRGAGEKVSFDEVMAEADWDIKIQLHPADAVTDDDEVDEADEAPKDQAST